MEVGAPSTHLQSESEERELQLGRKAGKREVEKREEESRERGQDSSRTKLSSRPITFTPEIRCTLTLATRTLLLRSVWNLNVTADWKATSLELPAAGWKTPEMFMIFLITSVLSDMGAL